jgi:hypothetical protein
MQGAEVTGHEAALFYSISCTLATLCSYLNGSSYQFWHCCDIAALGCPLSLAPYLYMVRE